MAEGWFRDTSDNKLVAAADSEMTAPSGHDFILLATIKAVYDDEIWQGGTWDGHYRGWCLYAAGQHHRTL